MKRTSFMVAIYEFFKEYGHVNIFGGKEMKLEQYKALGFEEAAQLDAFWERCIEHLKHARSKHPAFVERVIHRMTPLANEYLAGFHKKILANGERSLEDALLSELHEFLVEAERGDRGRMVEEAADIVAVLLRFLAGDMEVSHGK